VVGLLGCALGIAEDDSLRSLSRAVRIGVRCDRPGHPLIDFHTVVGGVMSAEGKVKRNASTKEPETVVSFRHYLSDASFLVAVQGAPDWIEQLSQAVQAPVWPYYLGRKAFPPACPVYAGEGSYASLIEALRAYPIEAKAAEGVAKLRFVVECAPWEGVRRRDEVDSRRLRTFLPRYTQEYLFDVPTSLEAA
jgi:CRISPR system Cascade subunit CasD